MTTAPKKISQALRNAAKRAKKSAKDTESRSFIAAMLLELASLVEEGNIARAADMLEEDLIEDAEFMEFMPEDAALWIADNEPLDITAIDIFKRGRWKTARPSALQERVLHFFEGSPKKPKVKAEDINALRRMFKDEDGAFRILKTSATRLEKAGLAWTLPGSDYRKSDFGREIGPWFVTAMITDKGRAFLQDP